MTRPRVGLNLLWLLPEEAGGAEEYAIRVLRALSQEADGVLDVTVLCNRRFPAAHPDLAANLTIAVAPIDGGSRPTRIGTEATWLAREARRRRLHLVHHLNNVIPLVRSTPSALTVHDLRPITLPETVDRAHRAYLRARLGPSVRGARVVMTPSGFVRGTVIDLLRADPDRVLVVSAPLFRPRGPEGDSGIAEPFFLYPAITNPHKNHVTLIEAFAKVAAVRPEPVLVLIGATGSSEPEVRATVARLGLVDRVRRLGRVSVGRLDALLRSGVGLVYPSRYEGYGLPLSEAMDAGCPVIASDVTALPEVVGEAGLLVDPDDVDGWMAGMIRLLDDAELRDRLVATGRARAARLTPAETARRLTHAYRVALEGGPAGTTRPATG